MPSFVICDDSRIPEWARSQTFSTPLSPDGIQALIEWLCARTEPGMWLDLMSGTSSFCHASEASGQSCVAIDCSLPRLAESRRHLGGDFYLAADAKQLPIKSASVACVVVSPPLPRLTPAGGGQGSVLEWESFVRSFVQEAQRVLIPNGKLALIVKNYVDPGADRLVPITYLLHAMVQSLGLVLEDEIFLARANNIASRGNVEVAMLLRNGSRPGKRRQ